jgi:ABC-type molybdate transport system substrate-binding protein
MVQLRAAALCLAFFTAAGCQQASTQLDAAEDVRAFLTAVQAKDTTAFNAHVDREALKADLQRQFQAQAGEDATSQLLGSAAGGALIERLIVPETFAFAMDRAAPTLKRTPTTPEIAAALKTVSEDRVCLPSGGREGPCAITFARQGDTWRLVSIAATGVAVQQIPIPPSAAG